MPRSLYQLSALLLLLAQTHYTASLPFGAKSKKASADGEQDDDDPEIAAQQNVVAVPNSVRGAASTVSKREFSGTDSAIDAYFHSSASDADASIALKDAIRQMANDDDMKAFLQETRRNLHRHPEVMYQEDFTSRTIQAILDELDIPYTTGWSKNTHEDVYSGKGGYGIVAQIGMGKAEQPCIILRADMDALPIHEATKDIEAFKSQTEG